MKRATTETSGRKYHPFSKEAKEHVRENEELAARGFVKTEGFEKTIALLMNMTQAMWELMQKKESFRMELFYNAETLNTNYCFYTPANKDVSADKKQEDQG